MNLFNKIFIGISVCWLLLLYVMTSSEKGKWYSIAKKEIQSTCLEQLRQQETAPTSSTIYGSLATKKLDKEQLCACVVDKLEQKHTPKELNSLNHDELDRLGLVCITGDSLAEHTHVATQSNWKITEKIAFVSACKSYFIANNVEGIYNRLQLNSYCTCLAEKVETQYSYKETLSLQPATLTQLIKTCAGKK